MGGLVTRPSSPSPVFGGGGGVVRRRRGWAARPIFPIADHDLNCSTSRLGLTPSIADYRATSPEDGGGHASVAEV